ncbi:hypothetical protein ACHAWF_008357 [Thalassiosira exigua]
MLAPSIIPHSHANAMSFFQRGVHFSRRCRCRGPPSSPSHPLRLVAGARAPHWRGTRRPLPLLPTTSANNLSLLSSVATKDDADGNHGAASVSETTAGETEALLGSKSVQSTSPQGNTSCHLPEPLIAQDAPLPPPLPDPNFSFRRRVLPPNLLAFNSAKGKERFGDSLRTDNAEAFFPLSQQFLNQSDPAYCGVSTLVLVLNALAMDPNVRWRGGWRWYGDESMLLERCCLEEERVSREGVTIEQFCGLARCQGVRLVMKRPLKLEKSQKNDSDDVGKEDDGDAGNDDNSNIERYDVADFRRDIIKAVQNPPHTHWTDALNEESDSHLEHSNEETTDGYFLVTSFARHALQQTGDGHFSPIAAYHPTTDSCLVLDVARFKYTPYWVSVEELYDAMKPPDKATGKPRGWILMYPPLTPDRSGRKGKDLAKPRSKEELEGKRPATCVPLAGSGVLLCPVEKIKVDYCSHR